MPSWHIAYLLAGEAMALAVLAQPRIIVRASDAVGPNMKRSTPYYGMVLIVVLWWIVLICFIVNSFRKR